MTNTLNPKKNISIKRKSQLQLNKTDNFIRKKLDSPANTCCS